jgi:predicted aldo/keto reductase-like oxidoreductase
MQLRKLGRTGLDVSAISLGTEYLINQPCASAAAVIHAALAEGINFFDLFFAQPQFRDNMGVAFAGHRAQALLGAHLGAILRDGQEDLTRDPEVAEGYFIDFLKRYRTDYVDIAFMHNCDPQEDYDKLMQPGGLCDLAERYRREGKTRFIGFSGHTVATALQAVESGRIDVLMFPINLAGNAIPGKRDLFNACAAHNVGLVAMKPFAGGKLLQPMGAFAMERWHTGGADLQLEKRTPITPVQCLSYVLAQVGVSTTIPGCKDREQLAAALAYWDASEEERDFSAIVAGFNQYVTGECVYCNHCLPCPSGIDIGQTIRLFEMAQHELTPALRAAYRALIPNAADCIACGDCEERCPFDVSVIQKMEQAQALFA